MRKMIQLLHCAMLLYLFNYMTSRLLTEPKSVRLPLLLCAVFHLVLFLIHPQKKPQTQDYRMKHLSKGACLLGYGLALFWLEIPVIVGIACFSGIGVGWQIGSAFIAYAAILLFSLIGLVVTAVHSRQHKLFLYILLLCTWFLPGINCIVLHRIYRNACREYRFEQAKLDLDAQRADTQICATRYPVIMVHGIFFRDWQIFNYWGRIPGELSRNGARISYASQQSANTVAESAAEVRAHILRVLEETHAEKVNLIAHSKGGLDCRYAISRLGMAPYVASLTTVNTPHRGCAWVDKALKKVPEGVQQFLERKYDALFTKLGDRDPHFLRGVCELTEEACTRFNAETPDMSGVRYTSIMSRMVTPRSAGFPLNLGYFLCRPYAPSGNDGLVAAESALYWQDSRMLPDTKRRGISHGDIIDLMRENIDGFDVREFYVQLLQELKAAGL